MHAGQANHSIRPATKESRSALLAGDQLCLAFVRGTCPAQARSRGHPDCRSTLPPARGPLARKRATLHPRDRVRLRSVQGASPTQSVRDLASWDFAFPDSTYKKFRGFFLSKRGLDSTRKLAARVSKLKRDAPARPTARQSQYRKRSPATRDTPPCRKIRHTVQSADFPSAVSNV